MLELVAIMLFSTQWHKGTYMTKWRWWCYVYAMATSKKCNSYINAKFTTKPNELAKLNPACCRSVWEKPLIVQEKTQLCESCRNLSSKPLTSNLICFLLSCFEWNPNQPFLSKYVFNRASSHESCESSWISRF